MPEGIPRGLKKQDDASFYTHTAPLGLKSSMGVVVRRSRLQVLLGASGQKESGFGDPSYKEGSEECAGTEDGKTQDYFGDD